VVTSAAQTVQELARSTADHVGRLDRELAEIDLLIQQARMEAGRHEQKRAQVTEKLITGPLSQRSVDPREAVDQLVTTTKRAALMEAQLDILEGKQRILGRFRESLSDLAARLEGMPDGPLGGSNNGAGRMTPELSRAVLAAQEDLRREIARQMHDGPAQSLTNIVLRAQIVSRLMRTDPARAQAEVGELVDMVQQTLESTKTFIFDVRPMVLDDLGLVPTLRRAASERGRRATLAIGFESIGPDRRLPAETESTLFRILDDAIEGFITTHPTQLSLKLDWTDDQLEVRLEARHPVEERRPDDPSDQATVEAGPELPPALADMINQRRDNAVAAADARARKLALPDRVWEEIRQRAASINLELELSEDGRTLEMRLPVERASDSKG
jgi:two-component system sensor histidine kinase DegS